MKTTSTAVAGVITPELQEKEADELHLNAHRTASLRRKLNEGRGWEGALVGLVRSLISPGEVTGKPGWARMRFHDTSTTFEFESFAEWITNPNGLATSAKHLIELLEISPDEEGRALADQVRQELKLPVGQPCKGIADNVRNTSAEARLSETGNSSAGVRRRIRNWIKANPDAPNIGLAQQWLAKLEANPKSRLHQQALREIGIRGERKKLIDVSGVSNDLLTRLHSLAQEEGVAVSELLEDALAVYFRMEEQPEPELEPERQPEPQRVDWNTRERPAEGFYRSADIARFVGCNARTLWAYKAKSPERRTILERLLKKAGFEVVIHPGNPPERLYEVRHKP